MMFQMVKQSESVAIVEMHSKFQTRKTVVVVVVVVAVVDLEVLRHQDFQIRRRCCQTFLTE